jgi:hypothetical protein
MRELANTNVQLSPVIANVYTLETLMDNLMKIVVE